MPVASAASPAALHSARRQFRRGDVWRGSVIG
jgi:hypothetical protein